MHWWVRGLSCKPNIYVSWSTFELRVRLAPLNRFKPSSKIFYWPFQGGTSYVDLLWFCSVLCLLCLCARLFICALWSPAGKGLTSWLSFVVYNCEFVTFPLVSSVRCGTWLYRSLIFAPLLTFSIKRIFAYLTGVPRDIPYLPAVQNKKGGQAQGSIQSITTPDPGYHMGEWKNITNQSQETRPFLAGDHKAAMNRRESVTITRHK